MRQVFFRQPSLFLPLALLGALGASLLFSLQAFAAEVIPPAPQNHFNDYAHIVPESTARRLDQELTDFERQTSNQILVAIYPKMQSDSSIDDYTIRIMNAWKVGLKGKNNGAVLFVFVQDRKMFINTGYGLEGALPDITCKMIIENQIRPQFVNGNYAAGLEAGINAMMAATRGEYKGTGHTTRDVIVGTGGAGAVLVPLGIIIFVILMERATMYGGGGRRRRWYWGPGYYGGWGGGWGRGGGWGGGSWGGGGGFGGGGGSFSGGGGMTGGGGAGGSW